MISVLLYLSRGQRTWSPMLIWCPPLCILETIFNILQSIIPLLIRMCTIVPLIRQHHCCDESNNNGKGLGSNRRQQSTQRGGTLRGQWLRRFSMTAKDVAVLDNKWRGSTLRWQRPQRYSTSAKDVAVLNNGHWRGGTRRWRMVRRYSTKSGAAVLDGDGHGGAWWWQRAQQYSTMATDQCSVMMGAAGRGWSAWRVG